MPSIAPSLTDLQSALERAERDLLCADMIDSTRRRDVEMAAARKRRDEIRAQITRIEETF